MINTGDPELDEVAVALERQEYVVSRRDFFAIPCLFVHPPVERPVTESGELVCAFMSQDIRVIERTVFVYRNAVTKLEARVTQHGGPHWVATAQSPGELVALALSALKSETVPAPGWSLCTEDRDDPPLSPWPFDQPSDAAVVVSTEVLERRAPILLVVHYLEDSSWAFLSGGPAERTNLQLVQFRELVALDPTVAFIAELPSGYLAERACVGAQWRNRKDSDV